MMAGIVRKHCVSIRYAPMQVGGLRPSYQRKVKASLSTMFTRFGHDSECQASCNEDNQALAKVDARLDPLKLGLWYAHVAVGPSVQSVCSTMLFERCSKRERQWKQRAKWPPLSICVLLAETHAVNSCKTGT